MMLYKVKFVDQANGKEREDYVVADNLAQIENEYADVLSTELMGGVEILTDTQGEAKNER